jgi:predicted nucleotidyltransferase
MKKILKLLTYLIKHKIINNYALYGAMAVAAYSEGLATEDIDIVVVVESSENRSILFKYLHEKYRLIKGKYFIIDDVPLDLYVLGQGDVNTLFYEAFQNAKCVLTDFGEIRVFTPNYLVAIAVNIGREKDLRKIDLLTEHTTKDLFSILERYNLEEKWSKYLSKK